MYYLMAITGVERGGGGLSPPTTADCAYKASNLTYSSIGTLK